MPSTTTCLKIQTRTYTGSVQVNPLTSNLFRILLPEHLVLQVARAGRFGTKGLAITFVSDEGDARTLNDVQDRFEVNISELPEEIDISSYSK